MPAKLITFTAILPNIANYCRYLTAGVPIALAVTTAFICSVPEDGLAPDSDHRSISPLFFSQAPSLYQATLGSKLTPGYSSLQALFQVELSHFVTRS